MPAAECIRATVLGAAGYSIQLSGRTAWIPAPAKVLPARNLQVLRPPLPAGPIDAAVVADGIRAHLASFDIAEVHRWTIRDGQATAAHFSIDTEAMLRAIND